MSNKGKKLNTLKQTDIPKVVMCLLSNKDVIVKSGMNCAELCKFVLKQTGTIVPGSAMRNLGTTDELGWIKDGWHTRGTVATVGVDRRLDALESQMGHLATTFCRLLLALRREISNEVDHELLRLDNAMKQFPALTPDEEDV